MLKCLFRGDVQQYVGALLMLYLPHMQSLIILGRQPALGLAELESLYGAKAVQPVGAVGDAHSSASSRSYSNQPTTKAALLDVDAVQIDFDRLGGSTKLAKVLTVQNTTDWQALQQYLVKVAPEHAALLPEGRLTIGISAYDLRTSPAAINATGLTLKKAIRATGRSVRLVPNKELELNTAQVLHNGLTTGNAWEILLVRESQKTIIAQSVRVQDIESYTVRDRERPKRDTRVGMLPPKLAQLLINLAVGELPRSHTSQIDYIDDIGTKKGSFKPAKTAGSLPGGQETSEENTDTQSVNTAGLTVGEVIEDHSGTIILDPFCGTGVVLQEALLMRYGAYGTDIDPRMVDYTRANIEWLSTSFELGDFTSPVEKGDATTYRWSQPFTHVASETYLGRPFTDRPSPEMLMKTVSECNLIIKKFLKNIRNQIPSGTRLCLAVPAWQIRPGQFKHLPLLARTGTAPELKTHAPKKPGANVATEHLDQIRDMGYNRISFEHARSGDLLYYRPDQVVARELLVLVKQ